MLKLRLDGSNLRCVCVCFDEIVLAFLKKKKNVCLVAVDCLHLFHLYLFVAVMAGLNTIMVLCNASHS